jgi:outer membrane immunogenic protein
LLYLTGGVAFGHSRNSYVDIANTNTDLFCPGCTSWSESGWRTGWTTGGGVGSVLFGNWTAKVEALYYQLSPHTVTLVPYMPNSFLGDVPFHQRFDAAGLIARVGLNYKFGDGIVARY